MYKHNLLLVITQLSIVKGRVSKSTSLLVPLLFFHRKSFQHNFTWKLASDRASEREKSENALPCCRLKCKKKTFAFLQLFPPCESRRFKTFSHSLMSERNNSLLCPPTIAVNGKNAVMFTAYLSLFIRILHMRLLINSFLWPFPCPPLYYCIVISCH